MPVWPPRQRTSSTRQRGGPSACPGAWLPSAAIRQRVRATLRPAPAAGRSSRALTPLASAASCSRRLWVRLRRSISASAATRPGLRNASSSAQRRAFRPRARTTSSRSGARPSSASPGPNSSSRAPIQTASPPRRQQPAEQRHGEAQRRAVTVLVQELVQATAEPAAPRQDAIDSGQPERPHRRGGCGRRVEPGEQLRAQPLEAAALVRAGRLGVDSSGRRAHGRASQVRGSVPSRSCFVLGLRSPSVKAARLWTSMAATRNRIPSPATSPAKSRPCRPSTSS